MIRYRCDKCGCEMTANDPRRFVVKLEIYAAAAPLEFAQDELARDHTQEIQQLVDELHHANPDEVEDQTYRVLRFDLCRECQKRLLQRPLG